MSKERFLAFTDAIIAIIATIMVLEFETPKESGVTSLYQLAIPVFVYALSFFMIMTVWYNHHQLYKDISIVTPRVYMINAIWLFIMSFFPFTTGWVGKNSGKLVPELLYLIVMLIWPIIFHIMERELKKENEGVQRNELTNTLSSKRLFTVILIPFFIVWFWPPIGLVSVSIIAIVAIVSFIKK